VQTSANKKSAGSVGVAVPVAIVAALLVLGLAVFAYRRHQRRRVGDFAVGQSEFVTRHSLRPASSNKANMTPNPIYKLPSAQTNLNEDVHASCSGFSAIPEYVVPPDELDDTDSTDCKTKAAAETSNDYTLLQAHATCPPAQESYEALEFDASSPFDPANYGTVPPLPTARVPVERYMSPSSVGSGLPQYSAFNDLPPEIANGGATNTYGFLYDVGAPGDVGRVQSVLLEATDTPEFAC
jgi:hypothetical protein